MSAELDEVELAASLVALGFQGDRSRFADARVQALARFGADARFRTLCGVVARGLGLQLVEVTPDGEVVLVAEKGTPFTPGVDTLLPSFVQDDERRRQVAVLALLAIIAEVFPTEGSVVDVDESVLIVPGDVSRLLLSRAEAVSREPEGASAGRDLEVRRAFAVVREVQPSAPTKTGRESAHGLEGTVLSVLRHFAEHGLVREARGGDGVAFRPTGLFAPHVRHLLEREAIDDVIEGLRAARRVDRASAVASAAGA